jgi:hypothetical protein
MLHDQDDGGFDIAVKVTSGNAEDAQALLPQPRISDGVALWTPAHAVHLSIYLDPELRCRAIEVQHIGAHRMLVPELQPLGPRAQNLSQPCFGPGHLAPKRPGQLDRPVRRSAHGDLLRMHHA